MVWMKWFLSVLGGLGIFLFGMRTLSDAIRRASATSFREFLSSITQSTWVGTMTGMFVTSLLQSSSAVTVTLVSLVNAGLLTIRESVGVLLGANIGTTVTNTLVSFGHVRREQEFKRAFAASTMHDFFNVIVVIILFPLDLITGFITKMAEDGTEFILATGFTATKPDSPIKNAIKWGSNNILDGLNAVPFIGNLNENSYRVYAVILIIIAIGCIFLSLRNVVKNMKSLMLNQIEMGLDRALAKGGGLLAILIGILITFSVQSSSITTSILVPIVGSGILSIENAFPITLGANIGTTITAVLASFAVDNSAGLTIALHHVFFNAIGVAIIYPIQFIRNIPVNLAKSLAVVTAKRRYVAILYVLVTFLLLPLLGVVLFN